MHNSILGTEAADRLAIRELIEALHCRWRSPTSLSNVALQSG
jgi:hypothetical protein